MIKTFFALLLITSFTYSQTLEDSLQKVNQLRLYESRQWQRFLHLEFDLLHSHLSEADGQGFFLHENGKTDPKSELEALVKEIFSSDEINCKFPARVKWLREKLSMTKAKFNHCSKYLEYKKNFYTRSVSIVFSSYYLDSPASAFGHTLLRLGRDRRGEQLKKMELLDTGISYGIMQMSSNPIIYSLTGVLGTNAGGYSVIPYFYKVREYNDFESRDLWTYHLNLSENQIDKMLDHLWELDHTYMDYFYFTENCSYNLITLLDAVNPDWKLKERLPFYVIPVQTIFALAEVPGLVKKIDFRPSLRKNLDHNYQKLSKSEKKLFHETLESKNLSILKKSSLEKEDKTKVLDVLMMAMDFKHAREIMNEKGENFEWKNKILALRSEYPFPGLNESAPMRQKDRPDLGHSLARVGLGYSEHRSLKSSYDFQYRFAMHDFLDPTVGHPERALLEFFHVKLKYYEDLKKIRLSEWSLINISSLNPWSNLHNKLSFKAQFGTRVIEDKTCELCFSPMAKIQSGIALQAYKFTLGTFFAFDFAGSNKMKKNWARVGIGPDIILHAAWSDRLLSMLDYKYLYFPLQQQHHWKIAQETRWSFIKNFSIGIKNQYNSDNWSVSSMLYYYH